MTTGLRLRLLAIVLGAGLVPIAPLAIVLLLQVRDALYARRVADARARIAAATLAARESCGELRGCIERIARAAGGRYVAAPCAVHMARLGEELVLCEEPIPGAAIELHEDLGPVREQLAALDARLLFTLALFLALLVAVAVWLLERGVVRRLAQVDLALEVVGAEHGGTALLPEGGDAVGRVGAAVNRLSERLREERQRTRTQIDQLSAANRALGAAREDLQRSERLASIGRLAAGVAHEVGNPVSALIAYAALMRERVRQGKDVGEYADRVEREAARIDRILRDLLDLARPREVRLERVDLRRAVELARSALEPQQVWNGVALDAKLAADLPAVFAEEHYAVQVFVNLLANAARAGAKKVRVAGRSGPDAVFVEVEDDGKGIAPEVLPRLFEPFFTTAAPGEGTGLGLALCHASMERIGGSISARNGERGAVFELRFRRFVG
ncbi:MAG: two-component sensor histidine kinase [Deltaproteobacteria bacterium]|nr:MAG: two-component sensor histidine kinase [Deltaproteobacteria bacterium]